MAQACAGKARIAQPVSASAARTIGWSLIVAAIMGLQTALIVLHQPFFDEWQAVQIAVQVPDLAALIENLRYESHPPLWYLFLRTLAAVVGPYQALLAASLICALATQWIILQASPFPKGLRVLIALAEPVLFEFLTVSRGHTLGLLLIVLTLYSWRRDRLVWLAIALLPLVDFFYGVFAIGMIALLWHERRLWWPGACLFALFGLVAAWSVMPAADYVPVYGPSNGSARHFWLALQNFSVVYVPVQGAVDQLSWNMGPPGLWRETGWALLLLTMAWLTRGRWMERLVLFGLFGAMLVFAASMYPLQNRHLFLLSVMMLVVLWRRYDAGERADPASLAWLVIGAACGIWTAAFALSGQFDRSRQIAEFIRAENLDREHWVAMPEMAGQGVAALTHIPFERIHDGCTQDFVRWNVLRDLEISDFERWVRQADARRGRFFVLSTFPLDVPGSARQVAHFPLALDGVQHFIYEVGAGEVTDSGQRAPCIAGLLPFGSKPAL